MIKSIFRLAKLWYKYILFAAAIVAVSIFFICKEIYSYGVFSETANMRSHDMALVLGTGKFLKSGKLNEYYIGRINAAAELYHAGKIKRIIVSGDNSRKDYNEPKMMRDDIIAKGVPSDVIVLDYAGFRTLDSVRRCKNIFKCEDPIIVSQYYHAKRALYLCNANGMENAAAYEAKANVPFTYKLRNHTREFFAWIKAWVDINITSRKAKFEK